MVENWSGMRDTTASPPSCPGNCNGCPYAKLIYDGQGWKIDCQLLKIDADLGWWTPSYNYERDSKMATIIEDILTKWIDVYPNRITIQGLAREIWSKILEEVNKL